MENDITDGVYVDANVNQNISTKEIIELDNPDDKESEQVEGKGGI